MGKMTKALGKTPPHDDELERAALGSMLFDDRAVEVARDSQLEPEDFYTRAHQRIYEVISSLKDDKGLRPDIQTVVQELKARGKLDEAGGAAYVSSLTSVIPSGANIEYYVTAIQGHSLRRALLLVASEIGVSAYDESRDSLEILDEIEKNVFKLRDKKQAFKYDKISNILDRTFDKIDAVFKTKKKLTGLSTGFDELDDMTTGFQPSEFIIIGARPSVGKTAIALNMAAHIAFRERRPVAFFSLEMPDIALTERLLSSEAMVGGKNMKTGWISSEDFRKLRDVTGVMCDAPFFIVDVPNMDFLELRSQARKLRANENVEIIFIDYLGLIGHKDRRLARHEQISEISRSLKSLARELKIPIVVLCQLNRETERSGHSQQPTLANIRDSGSIEQDADLVMFLHKKPPPKAKKDGEEEQASPMDGVPTELIIEKQRNGPTGMIDLMFKKNYTRFVPMERAR